MCVTHARALNLLFRSRFLGRHGLSLAVSGLHVGTCGCQMHAFQVSARKRTCTRTRKILDQRMCACACASPHLPVLLPSGIFQSSVQHLTKLPATPRQHECRGSSAEHRTRSFLLPLHPCHHHPPNQAHAHLGNLDQHRRRQC